MKIETVEARLNAISNCIAMFDEVKQSVFIAEDVTDDDNKAHDWLYRELAMLESKYSELLRLKKLTEK